MVDGSDGSDILRIVDLEHRLAELTLANRRLAAKLEAYEGSSRADERVRWEGQEARPDRHWHQRMGIFEHEALEPLNATSSMLQVIREGGTTHGVDLEALDVTEHLFRRLAQAVGDLIWIHRIDFGIVRLQDWRIQRRQVRSILEDAVEHGRRFLQAPERRIDVDVLPSPMWIQGDPELLTRMFVNLLFDASKRTWAGHRINVRARLENDEVVIYITDDGRAPGGDGSASFVFDNGLFLARELAELHDGRIEAQRDGHGENAFVVHLPLASAA